MTTTADDVWKLLAELTARQSELTVAQKETDKQLKENAQLIKEVTQAQKETEKRQQETDRQLKQTDRQLKELGKQIGGLGAKFGSFTEGLALPSMEKILRQRFGMEIISPSVRASKQGEHMELDVLAYTNGNLNTAYIVEVKSHAREDSIFQLKTVLQRFRTFFPEHQNKKLYGILASVDMSGELRQKTLQSGFYVAKIHDQIFELDTPDDFQPQNY